MSKLFESIKIKNEVIKNRAWVSPMCTYSSIDGMANDWHLVHLGSRAMGGSGLVMMEATAVSPEGRISPWDMGLWNDKQIEPMKKITKFISECGSTPAIQLAHAGRKASTNRPWLGGGNVSKNEGGWDPVGPSNIPYSNKSLIPKELKLVEIEKIIDDFVLSAKRSVEAGFKVIELHFAHGYLVHEFLSPISNNREDKFGGNFENRILLATTIASKVIDAIGNTIPVFARLSVTEYYPGEGWDLESSIKLSKKLKSIGIDLIDCSSGANYSEQKIEIKPGYQVGFSKEIRNQAEILTGAVGLITESTQAEEILESNGADAIFMAREYLRNPYWALHAEQNKDSWPLQYQRSIDL
tara:strand:- start:2535 stop:3596 length:1062 start_codon:yes stop_codon:yes gene_type:complete